MFPCVRSCLGQLAFSVNRFRYPEHSVGVCVANMPWGSMSDEAFRCILLTVQRCSNFRHSAGYAVLESVTLVGILRLLFIVLIMDKIHEELL